jgi:diaminopimelate epimerase
VTDFALPDGFWKQSGAVEGWEAACGLDPRMTLVSMGNPHAVLWCTDVARVPLAVVGPFAERHPWFPERMNVHFVQVLGPGEVRMRTWERGSGATQACGTGASAVCVAGVLTGRTRSPLLAHLPGGDLVLEWSGGEASVRMTGPAVEVFQGALDLGAQPVGQAR